MNFLDRAIAGTCLTLAFVGLALAATVALYPAGLGLEWFVTPWTRVVAVVEGCAVAAHLFLSLNFVAESRYLARFNLAS